jgi:CheY-like chemotaxis protein
MDIRLPGISGLEATRLLKKDPRTRSLVIWAITAYAMTEDSAKALAAGCDRYVTKPFDSGALRDRLREFIGQHPEPSAEALGQFDPH